MGSHNSLLIQSFEWSETDTLSWTHCMSLVIIACEGNIEYLTKNTLSGITLWQLNQFSFKS